MTRRAYAASLLLALPLLGCSSTEDGDPSAEPAPAVSATSEPAAPTEPEPTDDPSGQPTPADPESDDLPPVRDRISLPALMREEVRGGGLTTTG